jgi:hypothetical protein
MTGEDEISLLRAVQGNSELNPQPDAEGGLEFWRKIYQRHRR